MELTPEAIYSHLQADLVRSVGADSFEFISKGGDLWPDMSPREAAARSIWRSILKKFEGVVNPEADPAALAKFLECNDACKNWALQLNTSRDEALWGELKSSIYNFWYQGGYALVDHLDSCLDRGRSGPGAATKARGEDFYTKFFSSPLSCKNRFLYDTYKRYISHFPDWDKAESIRLESFGEPVIFAGSRLCFVPKEREISRTICVETSLGIFYQLGFGSILEDRLRSRWGIDLSDQQGRNRELARIGSQTGRFSTIDLSSASDTISRAMLKEVLPSDFFGWLECLRSTFVETPDGVRRELHMVSTMGNGFTFPLQTMLFASVVEASFRINGVNPVRSVHGERIYEPGVKPRPIYGSSKNFGVNGDDIVVPDIIVRDVVRLLGFLGFRVNSTKTFVEGPFRESCGGDYFRGHPVRGVYLKRLRTQQDLSSAINQLNLFSARTGVYLRSLVGYLLSRVRRPNYVPFWENDDAGIKVPESFLEIRYKCEKTGSLVYRPYRPLGVKLRIQDSKIKSPRGVRQRIYNPEGLYISLLQGSIRSSTITVRQDRVKYKRELGVAPCWDVIPMAHPLSGWIDWGRWNTAVYFNMMLE